MSNIMFKYKNIYLWLFAINIFISLEPYFIWNFLILNKILFVFTFSFGLLLNNKGINKWNILYFLLFFFFSIYWSLPRTYGSFDFPFSVLLLLLIIIMPLQERVTVFKRFALIFAISLLPGMIIYLLLKLNIIIHPEIIIKKTIGENKIYFKYFGSIFIKAFSPGLVDSTGNIIKWSGGTFLKYCGMYEEPGVVGTLSALLLIGDNFKLKSKVNIIILIAGILSFSLAFYILSFLYLVIKYMTIFNKLIVRIQIKKILLFFIIILFSSIILFNSNYFQRFITSRIRPSNNKIISGDNRTSPEFDKAYNNFKNMNLFDKTFGLGFNAHLKTNSDVSSYKVLIYNQGYFGFIFIIFIYLLYTFYYNRTKLGFLFLAFFFISLYQRPDIFALVLLHIFFNGQSNLKNDSSMHIGKLHPPLQLGRPEFYGFKGKV